jgi:hypothetical protein
LHRNQGLDSKCVDLRDLQSFENFTASFFHNFSGSLINNIKL